MLRCMWVNYHQLWLNSLAYATTCPLSYQKRMYPGITLKFQNKNRGKYMFFCILSLQYHSLYFYFCYNSIPYVIWLWKIQMPCCYVRFDVMTQNTNIYLDIYISPSNILLALLSFSTDMVRSSDTYCNRKNRK